MTLLPRDQDLAREPTPEPLPTRFARVKAPGILTTVQDLGRFGQRRYGISVCGALEGDHLRLANAAVGNDSHAAALELSGGQVRLEFDQPIWVCWFGSGFASLEVGKPQQILTFESSGRGILALAGGVDVPQIYGSRATDVRAGFGGLQGRALKRGDLLPLGFPSDIAPISALSWRIPLYRLEGSTVRAVRGPEWDALSPNTQNTLEQVPFKVSALSNRMGLRLEGAALELKTVKEMRSGAVFPGVVQLPASGLPIILLQDAGTVGGYPRILVVCDVDLPRVAVLPSQTPVYFHIISNTAALHLLLGRQRDLVRLERSIRYRLAHPIP